MRMLPTILPPIIRWIGVNIGGRSRYRSGEPCLPISPSPHSAPYPAALAPFPSRARDQAATCSRCHCPDRAPALTNQL